MRSAYNCRRLASGWISSNQRSIWPNMSKSLPCVCTGCTLLRPADPKAGIVVKVALFVLNIFLTPVYLVYHSINAYVVPCFMASMTCCMFNTCTAICNNYVLNCFRFTDKTFKPDASSLGQIKSHQTDVRWIRLPELLKKDEKHSRPVLFDETIAATDVCQGALGDCWLLAAFATLCENKTFIQNCFVTRAHNPLGKYVVRLYNQTTKKFYHVTIDDFIPCDASGRPLFTQFNGHEMWPLLLEKAYAKSKGSYAAIEGGHAINALIELTGYCGETFVAPFDDATFAKLQKCINKGCLLAAGSRGTDNTLSEGRGNLKSTIVGGHAYSILDIKTPRLTTQNIRLLKIRNPWGQFEWQGDWGDSSPLWKKHTGVALEVGRPQVNEHDGIFYMAWPDFVSLFNVVDVLYPNFGMDNIHYRVVEEDPYCGNCRGCAWGCLKYWFCLRGVRTLWFECSSAELKASLEADEGSRMLTLV